MSLRPLFFCISSPTDLAATLSAFEKTATVEAEYGDLVVKGTVLTLAHHGPRAGQPAPCAHPNGPIEVDAVGLSHIDLDTIGGCMAILGTKTDAPGFWTLAAFVDVNGAHRLLQSGASSDDIRRLYAYWAWAKGPNGRYFPPKGGTSECSEVVDAHTVAVRRILEGDVALLTAGDFFREQEGKLNRESFLDDQDGVLTRVNPGFVNHLYTTPDGSPREAIVAFNTTTGSVTVSFANPTSHASAREIVQQLWGDQAGGQDGIAGSPRGRRMSLEAFSNAASVVRQICQAKA